MLAAPGAGAWVAAQPGPGWASNSFRWRGGGGSPARAHRGGGSQGRLSPARPAWAGYGPRGVWVAGRGRRGLWRGATGATGRGPEAPAVRAGRAAPPLLPSESSERPGPGVRPPTGGRRRGGAGAVTRTFLRPQTGAGPPATPGRETGPQPPWALPPPPTRLCPGLFRASACPRPVPPARDSCAARMAVRPSRDRLAGPGPLPAPVAKRPCDAGRAGGAIASRSHDRCDRGGAIAFPAARVHERLRGIGAASGGGPAAAPPPPPPPSALGQPGFPGPEGSGLAGPGRSGPVRTGSGRAGPGREAP
jgi:hypothetical protein